MSHALSSTCPTVDLYYAHLNYSHTVGFPDTCRRLRPHANLFTAFNPSCAQRRRVVRTTVSRRVARVPGAVGTRTTRLNWHS